MLNGVMQGKCKGGKCKCELNRDELNRVGADVSSLDQCEEFLPGLLLGPEASEHA